MKGTFLRVSIACAFVISLCASALAASFHGIPHEVSSVYAEDGVKLSLFHLKGNESGPVILLEPGLVETAETLDGLATAFHQRGFDVYIGQVRLAGRGDNRSGEGIRNGLSEVTLLDFPAHLRGVIRRVAGRQVHLLGHSMGGIEILATFSNERLAAEFSPHIAGATLLAAPHELSRIPGGVRELAENLVPTLRKARGFVGSTLAPHNMVFDSTFKFKQSGNRIAGIAARAIEKVFVKIGSFVLNETLVSMNHTTPQAMRRFWFKELSALPLDLLIDFGEAAIRGEFMTRDGKPLIVPESVRIPVQVMRAELDMLVPWEAQESLFRRLGAPVKRLVSLKEMQHVDVMVADKPQSDFLDAVVAFHLNPAQVAKSAAHVLFKPGGSNPCERFLLVQSVL